MSRKLTLSPKYACAFAAGAVLLTLGVAKAWNFGPKQVNALTFDQQGNVRFTLFESGGAGAEAACGDRQYFHYIPVCGANDYACVASVNRMSSMLLTAKASGKAVYVQRDGCKVTEVAVK